MASTCGVPGSKVFAASLLGRLSSFARALVLLMLLAGMSATRALAQVPERAITECVTCEPTSVRAADIDGDGHIDILSASSVDDKVVWLENDGVEHPSFTTHTVTSNAEAVQSVYAADVDGDGHTDILSASLLEDKISWYENDGSQDPSFTAHTITTDADRAQSVHAADVDGDGQVDVLSASFSDDKIAWYENDGSENFTAHTITTNASQAESVYTADVDGDGHTDVLSASSGDEKIAWYENDGSESPNFTARTISQVAVGAQSVYATDIDGDDDTDVLSASSSSDKIAWYENDGADTPSFTIHTITTNANRARSVYAADVDGDDDVDVLSASENDDKIAWYENDGATDPSFTTHTITTSAREAKSVYAADVDGKGDIDVLSASIADDKVAWYENDGAVDPNFNEQAITSPSFVNSPTSVYSADIEGDNDTDVLSASISDDKIAWYENDGNQDPSFTAHTITTNAGGPQSVYAADVDGDDDTDVLSASTSSNEIAWYENDGSMDPSFTAHTITNDASGALSVHAADVDGDNDTDVLSASQNDDKIAWYENNGSQDPSFTTHTITTNAVEATSVYTADVDGDDDTDVLSASYSDDKIAWYENDGAMDPSFTAHPITTNAASAYDVHAADVDGDNDTDVLSASLFGKIKWYENDGNANPSFTSHTITTSSAVSVHAADVDGDGDTDVLAASFYDDKVAWYENDGTQDPSFTAHTVTTNAIGAISVHTADVDGSNGIDVLSASQRDDKIAWYENTSGVLPVELASFNVKQNGGSSVRLTWKTVSESGNAGFRVQHRLDPDTGDRGDWTTIGNKGGAGTTDKPQSYRFTVEGLAPGTHQFRLKQVDVDGTAHIHDPVTVELRMRKPLRLTAPAPNPARSQASLSFAVKDPKETVVTLYNVLGQEVATLYRGIPAAEETKTLTIESGDLASGTYFLRLQAGKRSQTRQLTVVR